MRNIRLISFSLIFGLLTSYNVLACGCAGRVQNITEAVTNDFNRASIIFSGTVTAKEYVPLNKNDSLIGGISVVKTLIYRFTVDTWWKGQPKDEIVLDTSLVIHPTYGSGVGCEYGFAAGKRYLVYANSANGKTIAHECSGTSPIENAEKDIKELQRLKLAEQNNSSNFSATNNQGLTNQISHPKGDFNIGEIPFADFNLLLPTNQQERNRREKRNKLRNAKFDNPADAKRFMITEWRGNEFGMYPSHSSKPEPALPALSSSAIVVGEITNSKAFLSEDKTSIYSEFYITINQILKNDSLEPLSNGNKITVWRGGGAVKFASGKIFQRGFGGKPMPHINGKYVFFLKYDAETGDYPLLTAYEIKDGIINPLDGIDVDWSPVYELKAHQTYKGLSEAEFINQVKMAITSKQDLFELKNNKEKG